jgi:hypothetical protein
MKTFPETDPGLDVGETVSSRKQTFRWADYSAKPVHDFSDTSVPLFRTPPKL